MKNKNRKCSTNKHESRSRIYQKQLCINTEISLLIFEAYTGRKESFLVFLAVVVAIVFVIAVIIVVLEDDDDHHNDDLFV
jgi:hypothetical protein